MAKLHLHGELTFGSQASSLFLKLRPTKIFDFNTVLSFLLNFLNLGVATESRCFEI